MHSDAEEAIRRLVWSGFFDEDHILEVITQEMFESDEIDEAWAVAKIREEFSTKQSAEQSWPEITDCDRLDQAFAELNQAGIIALQNAGYTQSDGIDDISQIYYEQGGETCSISDYCFYHGQDLERAVKGQGLMLTFGDIKGTDEKGLEIGAYIVCVLENHGLKPVWNGIITSRIEMPSIQWQRRAGA